MTRLNYKEMLENCKKKQIDRTFDYIESFCAEKTLRMNSKAPEIEGTEFVLLRTQGRFDYLAKGNIAPYLLKATSLKGESFTLSNDQVSLLIPGFDSASLGLFEGKVCWSGQITEVHTPIPNGEVFSRLVIPVHNERRKDYSDYIASQGFCIGNKLRVNGLIEFTCADKQFDLFDIRHGEQHYIILDSQCPIFYPDFERSIGAVLYSAGFLSGFVPREETFILFSEDKEFMNIIGCKYRRVEDSIYSQFEVVSPFVSSKEKIEHPLKGYVDVKTFSELCSKAFNSRKFLRCLKNICEGNKYPLNIRASVYSVSLEIIKGMIVLDKADKINPFKKAIVGRAVIKKLKKIINAISESEFNNKKAVISKIENINQLTNIEKFKAAFQANGLKLSEEDLITIDLRNKFLHGDLPYENEEDFKHHQELRYATYKLHSLIACLIMKYCGYSGLILNTPKVYSVLSPDGKEVDEPMFRTI